VTPSRHDRHLYLTVKLNASHLPRTQVPGSAGESLAHRDKDPSRALTHNEVMGQGSRSG